MSDRQWNGIFCILAAGFALYLATDPPEFFTEHVRLILRLAEINIIQAIIAFLALIVVLFIAGFMLLVPRKGSDD